MITKKLGFSRSFSVRFLYFFRTCRIDFFLQSRTVAADVILQIPKKGYASLCLEFKTSKGKQSTEQKEYQRQVEMAGSKYVIVRSVEQAIRAMQQYLGK